MMMQSMHPLRIRYNLFSYHLTLFELYLCLIVLVQVSLTSPMENRKLLALSPHCHSLRRLWHNIYTTSNIYARRVIIEVSSKTQTLLVSLFYVI